MVKKFFKNVLVGVDQLINVILGGDPDETISSRAAKWAEAGYPWPARIIDSVLGDGHCAACREDDRGGNEIQVARDKQLHFTCGFFISIGVGWLFCPAWGLAVAILAGIGKEVWDSTNMGTVDVWDAVATWLGGALGFLILSLG